MRKPNGQEDTTGRGVKRHRSEKFLRPNCECVDMFIHMFSPAPLTACESITLPLWHPELRLCTCLSEEASEWIGLCLCV